MFSKTWDAQSYSENSQLQYLASKKFFDTLTLKGNEVILDIGCGTGLLTHEIAKRVPQGKVIGIDSSDSMIVYANTHFVSDNLEYKLMSAEELIFSFKFDIILSSFCIHWIKDKQNLFQRVAAHLKDDGTTRFIMPFRHEGIAKIRSMLMTQEKWAPYFDADESQTLLIFDNRYNVYAEVAGLDNLVYQTEDVITKFEDATKLKNFLTNVTSSLNKLPTEELKEYFMHEVVNLYLKTSSASSNGNCSITYTYGKISTQGIKITPNLDNERNHETKSLTR